MDVARIGRMIRRGLALKSLYLRFPCRFTGWLLIRQVDRIERAMGPPDRLRDTWGKVYSKGKSPLAVAHEAKLKRERQEASYADARRQVDEILERIVILPNARSDSASGRSAG